MNWNVPLSFPNFFADKSTSSPNTRSSFFWTKPQGGWFWIKMFSMITAYITANQSTNSLARLRPISKPSPRFVVAMWPQVQVVQSEDLPSLQTSNKTPGTPCSQAFGGMYVSFEGKLHRFLYGALGASKKSNVILCLIFEASRPTEKKYQKSN